MSAVSFASAGYICPNPLNQTNIVIEVTELKGVITEADTPLVGAISGSQILAGVIGAVTSLSGTVAATSTLQGTITESDALVGVIGCIDD